LPVRYFSKFYPGKQANDVKGKYPYTMEFVFFRGNRKRTWLRPTGINAEILINIIFI